MHELGTIYYVIDTVEKLMVGAEDREAGSRHLLPGLPEDLSHHGVQKDLPLLRQRKHLPCHRQ